MTVTDPNFVSLIDTVLAQAKAARQRRMLVIAGDAPWCRDLAAQTLVTAKLPRVSWISNSEQPGVEVLSAAAAKQLLGQERDVIVFDAHAGFDADAFGAVSGVIPGGGLLLLLCPPLVQWEGFADPAAERIAVWPYAISDISGRFIRRLVSVLRNTRDVILIEQGSALPALPPPSRQVFANDNRDDIFRTADQRAAVAVIEQLLQGQHHPPVVLVADRGRGKTTALGIAAARLLQAQALSIVVTAPRPAAVQPLFQQVQKMLPEADVSNNLVQWKEGSVQFVAPDVLCLSEVTADLLLVDEAAAIPASLLQQFLQRYPRLVFSTTTHGYEGTGRGFAVRFRQTLDEQTPGWSEQRLQTPIRWANDDPLEQLVFAALLLAADSAKDEAVAAATLDNVVVERIDRDALLNEKLNDEELLSQLFGLLVVAHYRTRPTDLRNLLDGPDLSVYVTRYRGQVLATALVSNEGGFDAQLSEAIYVGKRRPRGHLIPQSLTTHCGLKAAAGLHCARVMRIAVHPAVQRRGFGRQLLQYIKADAKKQGADLFGASFGATRSLLRFWTAEKVLPVRIGFRRGHASGEYALMVLEAISTVGESVFTAARARFKQDLPHWLADPLRDLDTELADALRQNVAGVSEAGVSAEHDRQMLHSFARGERSYEDTLGPMARLLKKMEKPCVNSDNSNVLLAKVVQKQSWAEVAKHFHLPGKAEVLACMRAEMSKLLAPV
jgi:tRNA(Met) cytidine acetyltransferase